MGERRDRFLRLTFDGGRFTRHAAPVDVLSELATFQRLIELVARHLFFAAHSERQRVPQGFLDAARLYLAASEENCFTAELVRPDELSPWPGASEDDLEVFERARDLALDALKTVANTPMWPLVMPREFPGEALDLLADVGRRLRKNETLVVRGSDGAHVARVDEASRLRIATFARKPLIRDIEFEGEVDLVDDSRDRATVRLSAAHRVDLHFERRQRKAIVEALATRPVARVRVAAQVAEQTGGEFTVKEVEGVEIFDHERAPEIHAVWKRIDELEATVSSGWLDGEGLPPDASSTRYARDAIARLLVDFERAPRPQIYPTPDGDIQAEWVTGDSAADVCFHADGVVIAEATNATTGATSEREYQARALAADASNLYAWLHDVGIVAEE